MNPAEPDTMLTIMKLLKSQNKEDKSMQLFPNDQKLFKIGWHKLGKWKCFFPILGGIHNSISFVGCIGTLFANTGLSDLLTSTFGGVEKSFQAKVYSQSCRMNQFPILIV